MNSPSSNNTAILLAKFQLRPDAENPFAEWQARALTHAAGFDGFLNSEITPSGQGLAWNVLLRFADSDRLERAEERRNVPGEQLPPKGRLAAFVIEIGSLHLPGKITFAVMSNWIEVIHLRAADATVFAAGDVEAVLPHDYWALRSAAADTSLITIEGRRRHHAQR